MANSQKLQTLGTTKDGANFFYLALHDANIIWALIGGIIVFIMQVGYMLLEVGSVRAKNAKSILIKNLLDTLITTACWFILGYPFAFGTGLPDTSFFSKILGVGEYLLLNIEDESVAALWFSQWTLACTATTIVSGALAERTKLRAYLLFTIVFASFIYPLVVHWAWYANGWLKTFTTFDGVVRPFLDFSGAGVIHVSGGFAALIGAIIVGPRKGRFNVDGDPIPIPPHNLVLSGVGTYFIWLGWFAYNATNSDGLGYNSSNGSIAPDGASVAAWVAVICSLSAAFSGITTFTIYRIFILGRRNRNSLTKSFVIPINHGILAGLVSTNAGCNAIEPWTTLIIGPIAAIIYMSTSRLVLRWGVDDPLDSFALNGAVGVFGLIVPGLFGSSRSDYVGVFYGNGWQLLVQLAGLCAILLWVCVTSFVTWIIIRWLLGGSLRVSNIAETLGQDEAYFGGGAYPDFVNKSGPPSDGEVVIVHTDVEGSTKLWNLLRPSTMYNCTHIHDSILRSAIAEFNGYEVSTEGDAFVVAFHTIADAVSWCFACQLRLLNAPWPDELLECGQANVITDGELYQLTSLNSSNSLDTDNQPQSVKSHINKVLNRRSPITRNDRGFVERLRREQISDDAINELFPSRQNNNSNESKISQFLSDCLSCCRRRQQSTSIEEEDKTGFHLTSWHPLRNLMKTRRQKLGHLFQETFDYDRSTIHEQNNEGQMIYNDDYPESRLRSASAHYSGTTSRNYFDSTASNRHGQLKLTTNTYASSFQSGKSISQTHSGKLIFRGFRVRMAIDVGYAETIVEETSQKIRYIGQVVDHSKLLVDHINSGGQIVLTNRAFVEFQKYRKSMAVYGRYYVSHLGSFDFTRQKDAKKSNIFSVVQMLPDILSNRAPFFSPLKGNLISPSFYDAPLSRFFDAKGIPLFRHGSRITNNSSLKSHIPSPQSKTTTSDETPRESNIISTLFPKSVSVATHLHSICEEEFEENGIPFELSESDDESLDKIIAIIENNKHQIIFTTVHSEGSSLRSPLILNVLNKHSVYLSVGYEDVRVWLNFHKFKRLSPYVTPRINDVDINHRKMSITCIGQSYGSFIVPSPEVTIVFTHIVNRKSLNRSSMRFVLPAHNRILRHIAICYDGYECQEDSGSFLFAFWNPQKAIEFASVIKYLFKPTSLLSTECRDTAPAHIWYELLSRSHGNEENINFHHKSNIEIIEPSNTYDKHYSNFELIRKNTTNLTLNKSNSLRHTSHNQQRVSNSGSCFKPNNSHKKVSFFKESNSEINVSNDRIFNQVGPILTNNPISRFIDSKFDQFFGQGARRSMSSIKHHEQNISPDDEIPYHHEDTRVENIDIEKGSSLSSNSQSSHSTFTPEYCAYREAKIHLSIGVHSGTPGTVIPHPSTGRADYFGPVLNECARIASFAGQTIFSNHDDHLSQLINANLLVSEDTIIRSHSLLNSEPELIELSNLGKIENKHFLVKTLPVNINDRLTGHYIGSRVFRGVDREMELFSVDLVEIPPVLFHRI